MTLNILQLANKGIFPPDGGTMAICQITSGLAQLGHHIQLFTLDTPKHITKNVFREDLQPNIQLHSQFVNTSINIQNILKQLFSTRKNPFIAERFYNAKAANKINDILAQQTFDIIQLEGPYMGVYLSLIKERTKAPVILRAHNLESQIWARQAAQASGLKKILLKQMTKGIARFEEKIATQCQGIVCITDNDCKHFKRITNHIPLHVTPYGIDTSDMSAERQAAKNTIGYLGALDWRPNQEGLIWFFENIWEALQKQHPQLNIEIAGRNAPSHFIAFLKKQKNVTFLGEIPEASAFLNKQQLLIVPLLSGSGMRVKIIQAMQCKVPIVATPVAAEGISATHNHHIMIAERPHDFAAAINILISKPRKAEEIGNQGHEWVCKHYRTTKLHQELVTFYKHLIKNA